MKKIIKRKFVAYWFCGEGALYLISLGVSLDLRSPNIEIHLPFGFIKIGWEALTEPYSLEELTRKRKGFGYDPEFS